MIFVRNATHLLIWAAQACVVVAIGWRLSNIGQQFGVSFSPNPTAAETIGALIALLPVLPLGLAFLGGWIGTENWKTTIVRYVAIVVTVVVVVLFETQGRIGQFAARQHFTATAAHADADRIRQIDTDTRDKARIEKERSDLGFSPQSHYDRADEIKRLESRTEFADTQRCTVVRAGDDERFCKKITALIRDHAVFTRFEKLGRDIEVLSRRLASPIASVATLAPAAGGELELISNIAGGAVTPLTAAVMLSTIVTLALEIAGSWMAGHVGDGMRRALSETPPQLQAAASADKGQAGLAPGEAAAGAVAKRPAQRTPARSTSKPFAFGRTSLTVVNGSKDGATAGVTPPQAASPKVPSLVERSLREPSLMASRTRASPVTVLTQGGLPNAGAAAVRDASPLIWESPLERNEGGLPEFCLQHLRATGGATGETTGAALIRETYDRWCAATGRPSIDATAFGVALSRRFHKRKSNGRIVYCVALKF